MDNLPTEQYNKYKCIAIDVLYKTNKCINTLKDYFRS